MIALIHIKLRPYRGGGLEADCTLDFEDGLPPKRVRKVVPKTLTDEAKAYQWAERLCLRRYKDGRGKTRRQKREEEQQKPLPIQTLASFAELFLTHQVEAGGRARTTLRIRTWAIRLHLLPTLGERRLDTIDVFEYQELKSQLQQKKLSARSINLVLWTLYMLLKTAVRWKRLSVLPERPERLFEPQREVEIYSLEEYERLVLSAKAFPWTYLLVLLGGDAGLRLGEMLGLAWRDINLPKGEMVIRQQRDEFGDIKETKGKKSRKVTLTERLKGALTAAAHLGERVLVGPSGEQAARSSVGAWLRAAERRAQVIGAKSPHKLRHTFASRLLHSGANLKQVQALLGHARIEATHIYLHLMPGAGAAAIAGLDRLVGEQTEKH